MFTEKKYMNIHFLIYNWILVLNVPVQLLLKYFQVLFYAFFFHFFLV